MMKRLFQGDGHISSSYTLGIMIVTIATVWLVDVLSARRYAGLLPAASINDITG